MELSYRISEQDYREAWKLQCKSLRKAGVVKTIAFWVFILVCLMLLWGVVSRSHQDAASSQSEVQVVSESEPATEQANVGSALFVNVGPFVLLGGLWAVLLFVAVPRKIRALYRKDPVMQGEFTLGITPDGLSIRNTAGTLSQITWNVLENWKEGKNVLILRYWSQAYLPVSLHTLSQPQRDELRTLLAQVLPKR